MLAPHISVVNLGCRVNRVESDRITADLMRQGFSMVEPQDADLIVINTCAVTGEAEADVYKRQPLMWSSRSRVRPILRPRFYSGLRTS